MHTIKTRLAATISSVRSWQSIEWFVFSVVVVGAIFRLYNLDGALQFLGDQGRDVLIVARIFKEWDPVFIGPVTSVGNMYLGPLYYYFMLPWLWLTYPSPLGPQYAVAILGIITNWMVWVLGKRLVGSGPAAIATVLYAFSHTVVEYTRFSWNPNPIPLVSLLMVYSVFRAWKGSYAHWILVGLYGSVLLQLHYMAALTGIAAILVWLVQIVSVRRKKKALVQLVRFAGVAAVILVLSFLPLVLFDSKNNWLNAQAFSELISGSENFGSHVSGSLATKLLQTIKETHGRGMHMLFEIYIGQNRMLNTALLSIYAAAMSVIFAVPSWRARVRTHAPGLPIVLTWLLVGIFGTSLYKHTVFDHYIGFEYPVAVLISGYLLYQLRTLHSAMIGVVALLLVAYAGYNVPRMPLADAGLSIYEMEAVAHAIDEMADPGALYNIVLFSHSKDLYGMNYRYYLETLDANIVRESNWTEAKNLFVIDEERTGRNVLTAPVHEIVTFPSKTPVERFAVSGVEVIKLRAE